MNARDYALSLLIDARLPGWSKPIGRQHHPARGKLDPRDRALGETIAMSVTKNLLLLRHAIRTYAGRELKQIDPLAQMIVAIGLAQLRFLTRVPASAAVDEAVEQAKRLRLGRASGFVNAVLRKATREPAIELPKKENAEEYARLVLSCPPEVFKRFASLMGAKKALELCEKNNTEPPTIVRAGDTFKTHLREGVEARRHKVDGMWVVEGATEIDFAKWSEEGVAQVQDPTSACVVEKLELDGGLRVLDRCAGVGTKTIQLAEIVEEEGMVVAVDPSKARIKRLNDTLKKRGIEWVQTHAVGMLEQVTIDRPFDRILIDAPCSNSGVFVRRPEARYRQDEKSLKSLVELQRRIILDSLPHLRPGGVIVYSTCSLWPEENGEQIKWLLQQTDSLQIIDTELTLPSLSTDPTHHRDGGFWAALGKQ
jgi:16S rRNA (cytosine967-C5)-methyltransferase